MTAAVVTADVLAWADAYDGPPFHAVLCDPPYALTAGKNGGTGEASLNLASPAGRSRITTGGGFMGKAWDVPDVAFLPETWAAIARHVHPGGFIMAFGGSRTYHRLACAMEDAGLVIHPAIGWMFGSGFPKATRVNHGTPGFDGHRYGLQALKPAFEFVCVAQVPYRGRPVDCITATGAGALWIDGGRVPTGDGDYDHPGNAGIDDHTNVYGDWAHKNQSPPSPAGRWPPNLALCHSPECNGACTPGCPVAMVAGQSGERDSGGGQRGANRRGLRGNSAPHDYEREPSTGTATRFYPNPSWELDKMEAADPAMYVAKASRRERNAGCEGMPERESDQRYGNVQDARPHTRDGYEYPRPPTRNPHPTVKPLALTRWLATLLLPPAAYAPRRILCPFAGSGSEAIGAMLAGWEEVVAVEREAEYADIARARVAWWAANRDKAPEVRAMGESESSRARHESDGGLAHKSPSVALGAFQPTRRNGHAPAVDDVGTPMLPGLEDAR